MGERPILFSAPMVRALLAGTKTQTRRAIKHRMGSRVWQEQRPNGSLGWTTNLGHAYGNTTALLCPYGQAGDQLWVREACWIYGQWHEEGTTKSGRCRWTFRPIGQRVRFDNPGHEHCAHWGRGPGWSHRPSIHMPRWASRIQLEVTGVRVERLQDISEADALAEGLERMKLTTQAGGPLAAAPIPNAPWEPPRDAYGRLWESINGAGSWGANPWVWVVEFRRLKP